MFKTSIDNDPDTKQLIVEELALEQSKWHSANLATERDPYMGHPWMVMLVKERLRQHGLKARQATISNLVHVADLLARETIERQEAEFAADASREEPPGSHDLERVFGYSAMFDDLERKKQGRLGPRDRSHLLTTASEAQHQLDRIIRMMKRHGIDDVKLDEVERQITPDQRRLLADQCGSAVHAALNARNPRYILNRREDNHI